MLLALLWFNGEVKAIKVGLSKASLLDLKQLGRLKFFQICSTMEMTGGLLAMEIRTGEG
jgi:hypothetical protein